VSSAPHNRGEEFADQDRFRKDFIRETLAYLQSIAAWFLHPAVKLALLGAEERPTVDGVDAESVGSPPFSFAGEARRDRHRGRARVQLLSCGNLLLLGAVVCVDSVFEAHERN